MVIKSICFHSLGNRHNGGADITTWRHSTNNVKHVIFFNVCLITDSAAAVTKTIHARLVLEFSCECSCSHKVCSLAFEKWWMRRLGSCNASNESKMFAEREKIIRQGINKSVSEKDRKLFGCSRNALRCRGRQYSTTRAVHEFARHLSWGFLSGWGGSALDSSRNPSKRRAQESVGLYWVAEDLSVKSNVSCLKLSW